MAGAAAEAGAAADYIAGPKAAAVQCGKLLI